MPQSVSHNADIDHAAPQLANHGLMQVPDLADEILSSLFAMKTFVGAGGFGEVYHPVRGVATTIERQRRVGGR